MSMSWPRWCICFFHGKNHLEAALAGGVIPGHLHPLGEEIVVSPCNHPAHFSPELRASR